MFQNILRKIPLKHFIRLCLWNRVKYSNVVIRSYDLNLVPCKSMPHNSVRLILYEYLTHQMCNVSSFFIPIINLEKWILPND
jgi:hypothetical protein